MEAHRLFLTAGGGNAPSEVGNRIAEYHAAIDVLRALPASTVALEGDDESDLCIYARRGLYVFDSDYFGGAYSRLYAPRKPATMATLPHAVATAAGHVRFHAASFQMEVTLQQRHIDELQ